MRSLTNLCEDHLVKWRKILADLLTPGLIAILSLTSCGQDEIQLPDQQLTGKVAGEEWEYKSSNAFIYSSDLKYEIKFLSTKESGEDPCTIPSPGSPFVSLIIQLQRGDFSIPLPTIQDSPRFHISSGNTPIATSGFLTIYDISNSRIIGYLQAKLDDENSVEGSFEAFICN